MKTNLVKAIEKRNARIKSLKKKISYKEKVICLSEERKAEDHIKMIEAVLAGRQEKKFYNTYRDIFL